MSDKESDSLKKYMSIYQPVLIMFLLFVKTWIMNSIFILP
jgi:hypothetical protein